MSVELLMGQERFNATWEVHYQHSNQSSRFKLSLRISWPHGTYIVNIVHPRGAGERSCYLFNTADEIYLGLRNIWMDGRI